MFLACFHQSAGCNFFPSSRPPSHHHTHPHTRFGGDMGKEKKKRTKVVIVISFLSMCPIWVLFVFSIFSGTLCLWVPSNRCHDASRTALKFKGCRHSPRSMYTSTDRIHWLHNISADIDCQLQMQLLYSHLGAMYKHKKEPNIKTNSYTFFSMRQFENIVWFKSSVCS